MFGFDFQFEQISFWLGFIAASLFWVIVSFLRSSWPKIKEFLIQQREAEKKRRLAGIDAQIREKVLQRAQKMHLAAGLFPLDDILIIPTLIAPPPQIDPEKPLVDYPIVSEIVPYLPQLPELASNLRTPMLSLAEAIQNKVDIAIIGKPGSGKTIALAYLASLIARRASSAPIISTATPLFIHVVDLRSEFNEKLSSFDILVKTFSKEYSLLVQNQISSFIRTIAEEGNALLLLDGVDELPPQELAPVVVYLENLKKEYPHIQYVLTASPDYMDGLIKLGVVPLALSTWNNGQIHEFIDKWGKLWSAHINPTISKQLNQTFPHPFLLNSILFSAPAFLTPLEWTARVWALYAGDLKGQQISSSLDALAKRLMGATYLPEALFALANLMITNQKSHIFFNEAEKYLSKFRIPIEKTTTAGEENLSKSPGTENEQTSAALPAPNSKQGKKGSKLASSGSQILNALLNSGLLCEYFDGSIGFMTPLFTGYFSSISFTENLSVNIENISTWSAQSSQYQFLTASNQTADVVNQMINNDDGPLQSNLLNSIQWLRDTPPNSEIRSMVMRKVVQKIQSIDLPISIRVGILAAAISSNDQAVSSLARQFLKSSQKETRQACALACGMAQDTKAIDSLTELFADPELSVQLAACYALTAIGSPQAIEAVHSGLLYGDESIRLAIAEALSNYPEFGHDILRDAILSDDILTRRAAVFGIARINDVWATMLLEKIAVEDSQWVVRNAAGQALETKNRHGIFAPHPILPAHEASWLINFASKQGMGLSPEQSPAPILYNSLVNGNDDQKIAALEYLKYSPDEGIMKTLLNYVYGSNERLQQAAINTLWLIGISGYTIPPTAKYGY